MERKIETAVSGLGFRDIGVLQGNIHYLQMENQIEKNIEHEMETGITLGLYISKLCEPL